jgi:aspartate carbamoyltransferase catalytic subunit
MTDMLRSKDLLDLESLSAAEIKLILDTSESFLAVMRRPIPKVPILRDKTIVNLFFENSTRTRISFELAEKRLSADVINFSASTSSLKKGETLKDTVDNILAMRADMVIMRHSASGAARYLADRIKVGVVNAGDGTHEHPTQGLLDLLTMRQRMGSLQGKRVVVVGDIMHSRVARSNLWGLTKMGAKVTLCGPPPMIPVEAEQLGCEVDYDLRHAVRDADAINVLRIQLERQLVQTFPSNREYARSYRLDENILALTKESCFVLHPGPMNREVEITSTVADGPRQVILDQVTNGVAVRMAVIYLLSGGAPQSLGENLN